MTDEPRDANTGDSDASDPAETGDAAPDPMGSAAGGSPAPDTDERSPSDESRSPPDEGHSRTGDAADSVGEADSSEGLNQAELDALMAAAEEAAPESDEAPIAGSRGSDAGPLPDGRGSDTEGRAREAGAGTQGARGFETRTVDLPDFSAEPSAHTEHDVSVLRDVNLKVHIELGRTRMYIEDVLKLTEGSVVELDNLAGDPVDVYVNGRLVARGEVLVLSDNFCVRVSEIVTEPQLVSAS